MNARHNRTGRSKHERFVKLPHWLLNSPAYRSLKPGPRALLVELSALYNGTNNGDLFLSVREAARRLNVGPHTAGGYFKDLEDRDFIKIAIQSSFDHKSSKGRSWILTEHSVGGSLATKDFMRWNGGEKKHRKDRPKRKIRYQKSTPTVPESDTAVSRNDTAGDGYDVKNRHRQAENRGVDGVENQPTYNIPSGGRDSALGAQPLGSAAPSARLSTPVASRNGPNSTAQQLGVVSRELRATLRKDD